MWFTIQSKTLLMLKKKEKKKKKKLMLHWKAAQTKVVHAERLQCRLIIFRKLGTSIARL